MGGVPPYLVLLRVGFALPAALLPRRCALTAPFHPYPVAGAVCFLWHFPSAWLEPGVPDVIRHTALRSSDFPLPAPEDARKRPSGPAAYRYDSIRLHGRAEFQSSASDLRPPTSTLPTPA